MTGELNNMARVEDLDQIRSKRKAIIALFPYAVWRERAGDNRMVDAFVCIAGAPKMRRTLRVIQFSGAVSRGIDRPVRVWEPCAGKM